MNGVITLEHGHSNDGTAPVGQNKIHINLINYKHRCRDSFSESFSDRVIDTAYGTVSFQSIIIN